MEELFDILDRDGIETGKVATADEVHKKGYYHRVIKVVLLTKDNKVLIQQRSKNKACFPLLWDIAVTGHIRAGESVQTAVLREVKEETNLDLVKSDLTFLVAYKKEVENPKRKENMYVNCFLARTEISLDKVNKQEEELNDIKLVDLNELEKMSDGVFIAIEERNMILEYVRRELNGY